MHLHWGKEGMTLQENLQQQTLKRYIKNISIMNTQTANEYYVRLLNFERFLISNYGSDVTIDKFIDGLKKGKFNVYDALGDYCLFTELTNLYHNSKTKGCYYQEFSWIQWYWHKSLKIQDKGKITQGYQTKQGSNR